MQLPAFWCCSRIRQKPRRPCRWSARLREFFRRTCCPSTNPLAVRRSCPRVMPRTPRLKTKTGRTAMQHPACRCCSTLGRRRAVRAAGLPARLRRIFRRARCHSTSPLAVRRSSPRVILRTPRLKTKLTARQCSSTLGRRRAVRAAGLPVLPSVPARFSAVLAAIRQTRLQCAARVCGRFSRTPRLKTKLAARRCSSTPTGAARAFGRRRAVRADGLSVLPARLRGIFRLACCPPVSLLAVRRSCPRGIQRTSARRCSSTPTGAARAFGRRRAAHVASLAGRPPVPTGFSAVPAALRQTRLQCVRRAALFLVCDKE